MVPVCLRLLGSLAHDTCITKCDKLDALDGIKVREAKFNNKKLNQKATSCLC